MLRNGYVPLTLLYIFYILTYQTPIYTLLGLPLIAKALAVKYYRKYPGID